MIDEIIDGLYISDAASVIGARGKKRMKELQIRRVLTASGMPIREEDRLPDVEYKFIFMMDIVSQDIISNGLLREAIKYIDDSVRHGLNVIVHCEVGISRSVTLVAAYVMRHFQWSVDKAIMFVQKSRPIASPNLSFLQQLSLFERLGYRLDPSALATSTPYRNYCADTGTVPTPVTSREASSPSGVYPSTCSEGDNRHQAAAVVHTLNDCAQWATRRFRCRRCRTELFYDLHQMRHKRGGDKPLAYSRDVGTNDGIGGDSPSVVDCRPQTDSGHDDDDDRCTFEYLITPMKWMDLSDYQGKICCFKCKEKLGQYIWGGRICVGESETTGKGCGSYVTPWVHIQKCKVDASPMPDKNHNSNALVQPLQLPTVVISGSDAEHRTSPTRQLGDASPNVNGS